VIEILLAEDHHVVETSHRATGIDASSTLSRRPRPSATSPSGYGRGLGGLLAGVAGPEQTGPGAWGIAGVVVVGATASVATALWWEHADHDR
jgi:hypothetical protein